MSTMTTGASPAPTVEQIVGIDPDAYIPATGWVPGPVGWETYCRACDTTLVAALTYDEARALCRVTKYRCSRCGRPEVGVYRSDANPTRPLPGFRGLGLDVA